LGSDRARRGCFAGDRAEVKATRAADLKSLTHARQNRVQGLQIESGTEIMDLLVPINIC
jgi:hypothetical protein